MKEYLVFIATAWGPQYGGINAYNYDLCLNLQKVLPSNLGILCVIGDNVNQDVILKNGNIEFICLNKNSSEINETDFNDITYQIKNKGFHPTWFIGHDIFTGNAAISCSILFPSSHSCIIHHMDYESYDSLKDENININKNKIDSQRKLLQNADLVLGVGPKLFQSAKNKIRSGKCQCVDIITPGLSEINGLEIEDPFSIICFGRIEEKTEPIKQIKLAVFGLANTLIDENHKKIIGSDPKITLVGFSNNNIDNETLKLLKKEVYSNIQRVLTINAVPYLNNRDDLFNELNRHQLCMMLSIHEGFGLVGWEAIAAEVPLIITRNSGLYEFLSSLGPEISAMVTDVDIRGSYQSRNKIDINLISSKIISYRIDKNLYKNNAVHLKRRLLEKGYTWENMATIFLSKLNNKAEKIEKIKRHDSIIEKKEIVYPKLEIKTSENVERNRKEIGSSTRFERICGFFEPFSEETITNTINHSVDISAFLSASIGEHPNSRNPHKRYHLGHYYFVNIVDELLDYYETADKIHVCLFPSMTYYTSEPSYKKMLIEIQTIWNTCFHERIVTNRIDQMVRDKDLSDYNFIAEWLRKQRNNFLDLGEREKSQLDLFRAQKLSQLEEINLTEICKSIMDEKFYASDLEILSFACLMYKPSKWFNESWFVLALLSLLETSKDNIQKKMLGTNKITIIESSKNMKAWEAMSCCCKRFDIAGFPSRAYFKTLPDLRNNPMTSSNFNDAIFLHENTKRLNNKIDEAQIEIILRNFQLEKESNIKTLEELIHEGRIRLSQKQNNHGRKRTTKRNR